MLFETIWLRSKLTLFVLILQLFSVLPFLAQCQAHFSYPQFKIKSYLCLTPRLMMVQMMSFLQVFQMMSFLQMFQMMSLLLFQFLRLNSLSHNWNCFQFHQFQHNLKSTHFLSLLKSSHLRFWNQVDLQYLRLTLSLVHLIQQIDFIANLNFQIHFQHFFMLS